LHKYCADRLCAAWIGIITATAAPPAIGLFHS
jgi:hypothetical protein